MKKKGYYPLSFKIRANQNEKIENLIDNIEKKHNTHLTKTNLLKVALAEFLKNDNIEEILEKYRLL